jgi:hypothetical protein
MVHIPEPTAGIMIYSSGVESNIFTPRLVPVLPEFDTGIAQTAEPYHISKSKPYIPAVVLRDFGFVAFLSGCPSMV